MTQPWYRFYGETLRDRKVERCARVTETPKALVIGVWASLMALASDSPVEGVLLLVDNISLTRADIELETGLDGETLDAILDQFIKLNMLNIDEGAFVITNWDKRQYKSDSSTERVRRHREKLRECNDDVTLRNSYSNAPETETETETETNTERETKQRKPRAPLHPTLKVFFDLTGKLPAKAIHTDIIAIVGDKPEDLKLWGAIVKAYGGMGWNPHNANGMLDYFKRREIPAPKRNGNGRDNPPMAEAVPEGHYTHPDDEFAMPRKGGANV